MSSSEGRLTVRPGTSPPSRAARACTYCVGAAVLLAAAGAALLPRHGGLRGGPAAEVGGGVDGQHPPGGDDADPVGELLGLVEVVGREQDGRAAVGEGADELPEVAAGLRVEAGRGLVEEEQLGVADDAEGDVEATALAAAELADPVVGLVLEGDGGDDLVDVAGRRGRPWRCWRAPRAG